jgi:hypothetical protein
VCVLCCVLMLFLRVCFPSLYEQQQQQQSAQDARYASMIQNLNQSMSVVVNEFKNLARYENSASIDGVYACVYVAAGLDGCSALHVCICLCMYPYVILSVLSYTQSPPPRARTPPSQTAKQALSKWSAVMPSCRCCRAAW